MVNKWIGIGNVTRQPEASESNGASISKFGIACNEKYKDKEGNSKETVEFVNIIAWRGLADVCNRYLESGKQVYIEGKMKTSSWEKDGVKQYRTEIVASEMKMLGGKSDGNQNQSPQNNQGSSQNSNTGSSWGATQNDNVDQQFEQAKNDNINNLKQDMRHNDDDSIPF